MHLIQPTLTGSLDQPSIVIFLVRIFFFAFCIGFFFCFCVFKVTASKQWTQVCNMVQFYKLVRTIKMGWRRWSGLEESNDDERALMSMTNKWISNVIDWIQLRDVIWSEVVRLICSYDEVASLIRGGRGWDRVRVQTRWWNWELGLTAWMVVRGSDDEVWVVLRPGGNQW